MKKIVSLMMVLVMVVALAVPALAVEGYTKAEESLYKDFCDIVDKWAAGHSDYKTQAENYKQMAYSTLIVADLDSAACADLRAAMNSVDAYIAGHAPTSKDGVDDFIEEVVSIVNGTSAKYEIVVAVSATTELASVWHKGKEVVNVFTSPKPTTPDDEPKPHPVVPQTGFDMTGTIVVAIVLAIALLGSAVIISKKRLASNN